MTPDRSVSAFAPATIGNVICGFDVFGLALEHPGDRVTVGPGAGSGLSITEIRGDDGRLPRDPDRNAATVAIAALMQGTGRSEALEVRIDKGLPLSGGMGGSAASAVAATVAADAYLGTALSEAELLEYALAGEGIASGDVHLDNVAPALFGGLLLVRSHARRAVVRLPVPDGMSVALLHPRVEMHTREGRAAMGATVPIKHAVFQWGSTAAFVHGLHTGDWDLLADALEDRIAEPHRCSSIPAFDEVRAAALDAGAVACGISGAGPAVFSICRSPDSAAEVGEAMLTTFTAHAAPAARLFLSPVAPRGAHVVSTTEAAAR